LVTHEQVTTLRERITDEVFASFGMKKQGTLRKLFGWLFYLPTQRFASLFARADEAVAQGGLRAGCQSLVDSMKVKIHASGVENLQADGPLMILSNHPGAYDSVAIGSQVARQDFRIVAGEVPFYYALPNASPLLIYSPVKTDTAGRMITLRKAIEHLRNGGALLHFGGGTIEPDPKVQPGAVEWLERWSPSVEIMLRKAPETHVVQTVASGVLLKRFFNHPLARLRKQPVGRRRLAEFLQVMTQLSFPGSVKAEMRVHFSPSISAGELSRQAQGGRLMPVIIERQRRLLCEQAAHEGLYL
jgi:hypothetical protein